MSLYASKKKKDEKHDQNLKYKKMACVLLFQATSNNLLRGIEAI